MYHGRFFSNRSGLARTACPPHFEKYPQCGAFASGLAAANVELKLEVVSFEGPAAPTRATVLIRRTFENEVTHSAATAPLLKPYLRSYYTMGLCQPSVANAQAERSSGLLTAESLS